MGSASLVQAFKVGGSEVFFIKNEYMNIIYLNCGKYELDRKKIIAVIDTTFAVVKRKPEKNQASVRDSNL